MINGSELKKIRIEAQKKIEQFAYEIGIDSNILRKLENNELTLKTIESELQAEKVGEICLKYGVDPLKFFYGEEKPSDYYTSVMNYYDINNSRKVDIYLKEPKSNNNERRTILGAKTIMGLVGAGIFMLAAIKANTPVKIYVNDELAIGEENDGSICNVPPNAVLIENGHSRKINMGNGITEEEGCFNVYGGINDPKQKVWINKKYIRMIGKIQKMKIKDFRFECKTKKESDSVYGITNGIVDQDGKMQVYYIDGDNTLTFDKLPADMIEILQNEGQLVLPSNEKLQGVLVNQDGEKMKTSIGSGTTIVSDRTVNNAPISSFEILDEESDGKPDGTFSTQGESLIYDSGTNTFWLEEK